MPIADRSFARGACGSEGAATASYYEILGVDEHASHEVIKRQFLELSLRFQRDRADGAPPHVVERAAFRQREIDEAWAVLRSPADRARYDEDQRVARASRAPARRSRTTAAWGTDHDDVPVLEVLDAVQPVEPVPAPGPRTRRWRRSSSSS